MGVLFYLLVLVYSTMTMAAKNLTSVTWVHAVNNQALLASVLQESNKVDMIEADVIYGHLTNQTDIIPVMGHPPMTESDLSLDDFLEKISKFNEIENVVRKGVKLDFKSIEAYQNSMESVRKYENASYPLWINADILPGPVDSKVTPVNADKFLEVARTFPSKVILSIGWTTNYGVLGNPPNISEGCYDCNQANTMLLKIQEHDVKHSVTFPMRAGLVAESLEVVRELLHGVKGSTLTIWSSMGDYVKVDKLRQLIANIGVDRIYVDVPDKLKERLHLDDLPQPTKKV
ncbi:unnamed protein product [Brassicogethes aeneus]|uniref:Menorin-like domain-containing protein n=1 Tax=Brassicogethes aeneus TaxID=1431903 RepID=A0A9P0BDE9_BRAAE|nr:unnamed protein product [Brassicogethes aeneus]